MAASSPPRFAALAAPAAILAAGCLIAMISFGTARVLIGGALIYVLGLIGMAVSSSPPLLQFTGGILIGLGIAGTSFGLVLSAFARLLPEKMRPLAFGMGTAAGSVGQFLFAPLGQGLIQNFGWQSALVLMALALAAVPALAFFLRGRPVEMKIGLGRDQTIWQALKEAFRHRSYVLLVSGFFVCGFQLGFVTTHLPPYLGDLGIPAGWGALAIALIGFFNIFGSLSSGILSGRYPKRLLLSLIYFCRAIIIAGFILLPASVATTLVFTALLGFFWLSTVPPTQALVGVMFAIRYMSTLYGFVFPPHQIGAFLAVWLGGFLYDRTGSYDFVWWLSAMLGIFAGLIHLPIRERAVERAAAQ